MTASIDYLPIWKKDSTPAEWLQEIAAVAMKYPERFGRVVIIFEESNKEGQGIKWRNLSRNCATNTDILGIIETSKLELFEYMKGRT